MIIGATCRSLGGRDNVARKRGRQWRCQATAFAKDTGAKTQRPTKQVGIGSW